MEKKFGANVWIKGHKCSRCEHEWRPFDLNNVPETCPKCKSPYWQKPIQRESTSKAVKKVRKEESEKNERRINYKGRS